MDDIVEKDRTKLTVKNYEAVAIVKTALKRKKVRSVKLKVTNSMAKSCIYAYASYQGYLKEKKEHEEAKRREQLDKSVNLLKAKRAKQLANLMRRTQKNINQKRKSIDSATGGSERGRWKRIKLI
ncbi:hypothetical protein DPMN_120852 [Dreissena polymorpha]|uniref:Uncharacterized protein n=1 Tax=Dreissena polymorpha TaxID=45954 RepID=A0A9D4HNW3_DREPO|nr:hypothetical protein DPMN_053496 [Dreissena polymorpha]KAH3804552.1 hypothetical protein DPMN_132839 [Dreissena polymorpha]KAH3819119.1 hypothetical protein DPMN_120852 [Dreissena polymorpha]